MRFLSHCSYRSARTSVNCGSWETKVAINYSQLGLWKSIMYVVLLSHWFACVWGLQVALSETVVGTWVDQFQYCTPVSSFPQGSAIREKYDAADCVPDAPWQLYSASVYWAVMTITSIGYGDIHAADRNVGEQVMNTVLMLIGATLWGHVIGTFCGVVATMNPHSAEFNRRMDDLNRYLSMHNLPSELRRRLREYLHQTRHLQVAAASKELLSLLSPALQGEVTWAVNKRWLQRVKFFKDAEHEFLVQIAMSLSPLVFVPGELAVTGYLYIVHRGVALYGGRVLTSGKVWGEDCIISSPHLQKKWCARAMNYLEVFMISRDDVLECAAAYPKTYEAIRKQALRLAVRRQFILAAKLITARAGKQWVASARSTFDRVLDQATVIPISEVKLQGRLTTNRLEGGPNSAILSPGCRIMSEEEEEHGDESEKAPSASLPRVSSPSAGSPPILPPQPVITTNYGRTKKDHNHSFTRSPIRGELEEVGQLLAGVHNNTAQLGIPGESSQMKELRRELTGTITEIHQDLRQQINTLQANVDELLKRIPPPVA